MPSLKRSPIAISLLSAGLAMAALAGLAAAPTSSQAGWTPPSFLDTTFNPNANGVVNKVLVQSDGKILIGGAFTTVGGETRGRVARLNADGTVDNTFGDPVLNGAVRSIALQTDGKILVGGEFTDVGGQTRNRIARLNADGTLDTSFNIGSLTGAFGGQPIIHAISVLSDGKILIGGYFSSITPPAGTQVIRAATARLDSDGTIDTSYTGPLAAGDRVWALKVLSGGKILTSAQSATVANRLVLTDANGARDSSFVNPNPNEQVFDLAVQSDGKILAGGLFTSIAGETRNRLARLNADGSLDTGFNPNVSSAVESVSLRADGKILVGGRFTSIGDDARTRVAILNADGTVNDAFFPTVNSDVYSAVSQADGNILIGGFFTTVEGQTRNRVARVFPELPPAAPANTSSPTISGTAEVGQTLTANIGDWTGYPEPEFTYQWQRCEEGTPAVAGVNWTSRTPASNLYWRSVAWGGPAGQEKFVAVALGTTNPVMTSPDGVTWTAPTVTGVNGGWSVAWGGPAGQEKFVAVASSGTNRVMTSPDGVTWTARTSAAEDQFWRSVTYGNGTFVAVAQSGSGKQIMTSPDGINWTLRTPSNASLGLISVAWGDPPGPTPGQFVAVAVSGTNNQVMTSEDGVTWETRATPGTGALTWQSVTWGGPAGQEKFVAVAAGGPAGDDRVMTSPDGVTWTGRSATSNDQWSAVTWGGPAGDEKFVAAGGGSVMTSPDGITWTGGTAAEGGLWGGLTWGGPAGARKFVAVGGIFDSAVRGTAMTSEASDGLTCTDIDGAEEDEYTLTADDEGKKVRVKVTGTNDAGSASATSAPTDTVEPAPVPINTEAPTISGTPEVGQTLTADPGNWSGDPTFAYQWQRCEDSYSAAILGSTGSNPYGIVVDPAGNVYAANYGGNTVTKLLPNGSPAGGAWPVTVGSNPAGLALDSAGNVYSVNFGTENVTKITPVGSTSTLGATGPSPYSLALDSAGNVYTANNDGLGSGAGSVTKIPTVGSPSTFGSTGPGSYPRAIAVDSAGNVYTANYGTNNVTKLLPDGSPAPGWPASAGDSSGPYGIAVDSDGNVYTANLGNDTVSKLLPNGEPAGAPWPVSTGPGSGPHALAIDSAGNVFTANGYSNNVTKITPNGTPTTLDSAGSYPQGIALDSAGNVYTSNYGSNNVTKLALEQTCTDISGADDPTYTLTGADEGKKVRVKVTATNDAGSASAESDPTATIDPAPAPVNTDPPTISGETEVPQTLTADPGEWTGEPTFEYQWQRCDTDGTTCTDIDGATEDEYTLTGEDEGKKIRIKVTATNDAGTTVAYSDLTDPIDPEPLYPPENTELPTTEGSAGIGASLSADKGTWTGNPAPTYAYQWQRCDEEGENCTDINGATSDSYTQTRDDVGKEIRVKVTGSNSEGSASAFSAPTEIVPGVPANTTPPSISGDPKAGETLTAEPGEWSAYPDPTFTYQWQRCNADGTGCVDIDGATEETYDPTAADTGKKIRVKVTATNDEGEATVNTAQVGPVAGPPANITPPTISGNPAVGSTLTADPGTWSGQPAPTFTYQWVVCNEDGTECAPIAGATARTYTLTAAETGKLLFAVVTASNSEGEAEANSAPTGVIQPKPAPSGKPKLKVTVKTPKKVKAGKRFTIKVKTTNRAKAQTTRSTAASSPGTTAKQVRTCVKLPRGIFVVNARGGKVSGRTVCWTRSSLAAGRSVGYSVVVRSSSSDSGSARISATAGATNSAGATAKAKAKAKLDVVEPKPKPKPKPPTG